MLSLKGSWRDWLQHPRFIDVAQAVKCLNLGKINGSSSELLWGLEPREIRGFDGFDEGFAFEVCGGVSSHLRQGQLWQKPIDLRFNNSQDVTAKLLYPQNTPYF
jgi:hypothetical protein